MLAKDECINCLMFNTWFELRFHRTLLFQNLYMKHVLENGADLGNIFILKFFMNNFKRHDKHLWLFLQVSYGLIAKLYKQGRKRWVWSQGMMRLGKMSFDRLLLEYRQENPEEGTLTLLDNYVLWIHNIFNSDVSWTPSMKWTTWAKGCRPCSNTLEIKKSRSNIVFLDQMHCGILMVITSL